jgi:GPN-loop GTPase
VDLDRLVSINLRRVFNCLIIANLQTLTNQLFAYSFVFNKIVVGPAGSGKSTYCNTIQQHAAVWRKTIKVCNLDPAAENFKYTWDIDVRDLVSLEDVMEELEFGPNGGLIYWMEYLLENMDWLHNELTEFAEDAYILFDCPGQIELYSHMKVMTKITEKIKSWGYNLWAVFWVDATTSLSQANNFISNSLVSLSTMAQIELPHLNILTKWDMVEDKKTIEYILDNDPSQIISQDPESSKFNKKYNNLNKVIAEVLEDFSLVRFVPLDIGDEESIERVMIEVDTLVQYKEYTLPDDAIFNQQDTHE